MKTLLYTKSLYLQRTILAVVFGLLIFHTGCEESPPNGYTPQPFVQGFLFVDQPIAGITVSVSQPLTQPFKASEGWISNASISISDGVNTFPLSYHVQGGVGSYFYTDTTFLVQPETKYSLTVVLPDGTSMGGETTTPKRITWVTQPKPVIQYPQDTTKLLAPDSIRIAWTPGNNTEYVLRSLCLDTLGYGTYLSPPTQEINGRTNNIDFFEGPDVPMFYSIARWGFLQATTVNTVWTAFRWYGKHEVSILAPDDNFLSWFKATQFTRNGEYRSQFGSIRGGAGVFGSASVVSGETFVLKRQK